MHGIMCHQEWQPPLKLLSRLRGYLIGAQEPQQDHGGIRWYHISLF